MVIAEHYTACMRHLRAAFEATPLDGEGGVWYLASAIEQHVATAYGGSIDLAPFGLDIVYSLWIKFCTRGIVGLTTQLGILYVRPTPRFFALLQIIDSLDDARRGVERLLREPMC